MQTTSINEPGPQPDPQPSLASNDCLSIFLLIGVWVWSLVVVFGLLLAEFTITSVDTRSPNWHWAYFPLVKAVLVGLPLLPLSIFWRNAVYKRIFTVWLWAAGFSLFWSPMHLMPAWAYQAQTVILIVTSLIFTYLARRALARTAGHPGGEPITPEPGELSTGDRAWIGVLLGFLFTIPWTLNGALGSLLDTILSLLAAALLGRLAAVLINTGLAPAFRDWQGKPYSRILLGGFASGVVLVLLSAGLSYSFGAIQLLLALSIPGLAWGAFSLASSTQPRRLLPVAGLVGIAYASVLVMFDPDELALIINTMLGEILFYAAGSALIALAIALIAGTGWVLVIWFLKLRGLVPGWFGILLKLSALGAAGLILITYFAVGRPGFYGEDLFVVLKDQAQLPSLPDDTDYLQRRQAVYDTLTNHASQSQAGIRAALDRFGIPYQPYYLVNGLEVRGGPLVRLWLNTRADVDRVLDNPQLRPLREIPPASSGVDDSPIEQPWNLEMIHADRVWSELGVTGQNVIVGQSDSGVQGDHPELSDSYRGLSNGDDYNWLDPWYHSPSPVDIGGHGTHTLGSVLGNATGVAPDAEWIACVNLARNLGNPAYYLDCMQFMLAPYPQAGDAFTDGDPAIGAMVLNNSWGCPLIEGCDAGIFLPAVRALRAAGIFTVASAGNDGPGCASLDSPLAIYDEVFSVGAIDRSGDLAFFSSIGPVKVDASNRNKPDLVAPGVDVHSAYPNNTYSSASGTSMAGPHAVGVVTLMWSANPELIGNIDATEQILIETTIPYSGVLPQCPGSQDNPSTAVGYGILDAFAAVESALQWSSTP